jgi:DNA-binding transcriptional ArsR family regulator
MTDPFQAIADPTRRAILDLLRAGDAPAGEIAAGFAMSRPAVSKHLRVLRDARLVRERPGPDDARQRVYTLTAAPMRDVARWAQSYEAFWSTNLASLKRHLEREPAPRGRARRDAHP